MLKAILSVWLTFALLVPSHAPMQDEQLRTVLRAAQQAQRGRYVTAKLVGDVPRSLKRVDEFLMDSDDGRLRFMRYSTTDPYTKREEVTLTEFTRQLARLCAGGPRPTAGMLAINYRQWDGKWQPAYGSVAMTSGLDLLNDMITAPAGGIIDAGVRSVDGRQLRGLSWRVASQNPAIQGGQVLTVWIDSVSSLMRRATIVITMEGKTVTTETAYEYPAGKAIVRPAGVLVPDCV